jgi:micrococcal nuclease
MKRIPRRFLLPIAALSVLFAFLSSRSVDYNRTTIVKVFDGDTVALSNGEHVRYIGIDTPELERKTAAGWQKVHEPFAEEARRFNEELVSGKTVRFDFDVQTRDKFKRILAYCFDNEGGKEVFVEAELLRNGFAYLYTFPPNIKYVEALASALEEAKSKKAGIWSMDLNIDSKDALNFLGQRKMVTGTINKSRSTAKVIRLSMDGLLIVVFKNELELFQRKGIDPAQFYKGKKVRAFGLIKEYQGLPEMIVSNPWQIEVL